MTFMLFMVFLPSVPLAKWPMLEPTPNNFIDHLSSSLIMNYIAQQLEMVNKMTFGHYYPITIFVLWFLFVSMCNVSLGIHSVFGQEVRHGKQENSI